ncbi:hypothetical protein [Pseudescherichia vulneris]|uniref:hypothetical protein n=1 Tax=Pseudescherichia vulneris TaxID=566 RepID=UPI001EDFD354|nr:hypothetical protein [Pseudescherichia vulneris]
MTRSEAEQYERESVFRALGPGRAVIQQDAAIQQMIQHTARRRAVQENSKTGEMHEQQ